MEFSKVPPPLNDNYGNSNLSLTNSETMPNEAGKLVHFEEISCSKVHSVCSGELPYCRERELITLLENSPDIIVLYDRNLNRIYANPAFTKETGFPGTETAGVVAEQMKDLGNQSGQSVREMIKKVMETGLPEERDFEGFHDQNNLKCFSVRAVPEFDKEGRVERVMTISRNISDRRKSEILLAKREQEYRSLIENSPFNIIRYDSHCKAIYGTDYAYKTISISKIWLPGKTPLETFPDGLYEGGVFEVGNYMQALQRVIASGEKEEVEMHVYENDGGLLTHNVIFTPEKDAEGKIIGALAFGYDITERKKAENLILQREHEYRILVENSPENIIRYNIEGKAIYKNRANNPLNETGENCPVNASPEKPPNGIIEGENIEMENYRKTLQYVLKTGEKREIEMHTVSSDGIIQTHSIVFTPERDSDGNITGALVFGLDISERKKIEQTNLQLTRDLSATLQAIPDLLFEVDNKGTYLNIWARDQTLLIQSGESLIGKRMNDVLPSHVVQIANGSIMEARKKGVSYGNTYHLDYPDGRRWFELSISMKPDCRTSEEHFLALARDITDRVKAERALRESEEKFSAAFRNSPIAIAIIDSKENIYIDANESFSKLTEYRQDELIGQNAYDLRIFSNSQRFGEMERIFRRNGNIKNMEFYFTNKCGVSKCGLVSAATIFIGGESCILLQIIDISKRKKAERKLLEEQFKLSEVQRIGQIGSWDYNFKNAQVTFSSETNRIYEMEPERKTSDYNYFLNLVHPEDKEHVHAAFRDSVIYQEPCIVEHRLLFPDGKIKYVFQHSETFYDINGKPFRSIGTIQDMTLKKEAELELRAAKEKAEESNRLKSAFLATMNHELRTPLNHILGFSELIEYHTEKALHFAKMIKTSGQKLLNIIEDIFQLALAEQSEIVVRNDTFNLGSMFSDSQQVLSEILEVSGKRDNIELVFSFEEALLCGNVIGDLNKISQVLGNLFKNAVKFTDKGYIEFGLLSRKPGTVTFFVKDTGIGIPKDKHSVIFEFFRQGDDSNTRKHDGIGIGLAISKRITEVLRGKLTFVSEPNNGSTFYFNIPVVMVPGESIGAN